MELNEQQKFAEQVVREGHNVFITGKAGTGKSCLVRFLFKKNSVKGTKCQIICPTGIACEAYKDEKACTTHSFFGIGIANRPSEVLLQEAQSKVHVCKRVEDLDVLFMDEVSMSSRFILELVDDILKKVKKDPRPFGGIQVVTVGDFKQLPPVPNRFDPGEYMFTAPVFQSAFSHQYELTIPMRQNSDEKEFLYVLQCLQDVTVNQRVMDFMASLDRPLHDAKDTVHIYFRNDDVTLHNMEVLRSLEGECTVYDADEKGDCRGMKCPAEKSIYLKKGAKVMLVWNLNERLHNGSMGTIKNLNKDQCEVTFPGSGSVTIKKQCWCNYNEDGQVVGCRTQIPLKLSWSMTAHKSQGLTLPSVTLHCSREFTPGLIYVACSRVRSQSHLQVKNFKKSFLMRLPKSVTEFHTAINGYDMTKLKDDFSCCRNPHVAVDVASDVQRHVQCRYDDDAAEEDLYADSISDEDINALFNDQEALSQRAAAES